MALIIEDGTGKTDAQSFVTAVELTAYAVARGVTISGDIDSLLVKAMDYFVSREGDLSGSRTFPAVQALPYPREGVYIYDSLIANNVVPTPAKNAQMAIALELQNSDLLGATGQDVKREKVEGLEVEYFSGGAQSKGSFPAIEAALEPLLSEGSGDWSIPLSRSL